MTLFEYTYKDKAGKEWTSNQWGESREDVEGIIKETNGVDGIISIHPAGSSEQVIREYKKKTLVKAFG